MAQVSVLLVDDEEELVRALAERLELRRFEVRVALSGEQGLRTAQMHHPDVMVLDLKMPGMDGMEVLRRMRKVATDVQVIVLTGHGSSKDQEVARRLGAFEYLQKPVDIADLIDAINRAHRAGTSGSSG